MLLPQTAEYSIRAVATLALFPKGNSASALEISERSAIPLAYLSKILSRLVQAEILTAKKGPGGGFKFAKSLEKISLLSVLAAVGHEFDANHCAFGWDKCSSLKPCPLHETFSELKEEYYNWALTTTLAKIVAENPKPKFKK